MAQLSGIEWPNGHSSAFSVFDDTDFMTLENGPYIYREIERLGLRFTKSVWPLPVTRQQRVGGSTCGDRNYLSWVLQLQRNGHEIGFHNATDHASTRAETEHGLAVFAETFGAMPRVGADHSGNVEAMYWGPKRLSGIRSLAYSAVGRAMRPGRPSFSGEDPNSEYFWGDLCREHIKYWRNFCFNRLDLTEITYKMPYHDPLKPYVNYWFTSTDGSNRSKFVRHFTEDALDRLELRGGLCIMYTHFGDGFTQGNVVDSQFIDSLSRIAERNIWVAPVSEVLDHVLSQINDPVLTDSERRTLEHTWIKDRIVDSSMLRERRPKPRIAADQSVRRIRPS